MPTFLLWFFGVCLFGFWGERLLGWFGFFKFLMVEINSTLEEVCGTVVKTIRRTH